MTQQAKTGDTVKVHYTGTLDDGTVFDSSEEREPITFEIGAGNLIPGFEVAVEGMNIGDKKSITIEAKEAYGEWLQENVIEVPKNILDGETNPEIGQQVFLQRNDGATFSVVVKEISEESIILDANHPLAGKDLNFELRLVEIV